MLQRGNHHTILIEGKAMAAVQAQLKKPTGTAAVAQRIIRKGGDKPAPSDTINAKLTPGETVIPKELSEEALAPLVALYQQQGHLTQQDIEQFLYPILQNLEGGEEGMNGGGRVGYAGGGGVVQVVKDLFTPANVLRNRREVEQMKAGTYQGQPEQQPAAEATQAAPMATGQGNQPRGLEDAVTALAGRKGQIDKAVNGAQGFVAGGWVAENPIQKQVDARNKYFAEHPGAQSGADELAAMPGKLVDSLKADPSAQAYSQAVNKALAYQPTPTAQAAPTPVAYKAGQAVGDVANSLQSASKGIANVAGVAGDTVKQTANEFTAGMNNQPVTSIAPPTPAKSVADVAARVSQTPAMVESAKALGTAIDARNTQPDPVGNALLEGATVPQQGGRMGNKQVNYNIDGQGGIEKVVNGKVVPVNTAVNVMPSGVNINKPGSNPERAMAAANALKGDTFLGKQEGATAAQKLALYNGMMGEGLTEGEPQGVAAVAQRLQAATPSRWEQELKARNDPLTGVGGVVADLQSRLATSHKKSTANALAEMLNVANARDRTQLEGNLGQDRINAELQGHELAADAVHEKNLVDAQGNQISAVERIANMAKGRGKETQDLLKAQGMQALINAKTPEQRQSVMEKYGPLLQQEKAETGNDVMQIDDPNWVQPPNDPLAVAPKILVRVNKNAGQPEQLKVPGQQTQDPYAMAKAAIAKGADKKAVNARLKAAGLTEIP